MLAKHPEWLRRPIVILGDQIVVGYDETALRALVGRLQAFATPLQNDLARADEFADAERAE